MTVEEKRLYHNQIMKRWRLNNPEKVKESNKKYRSTLKAKEKHKMKMKEWRSENPEKVLEANRKHYNTHKKKINENRRIKYKTDDVYRDKRKQYDKKYKLSGKRKEAYDRNPNKHDRLKQIWIRIKTGDYKKYSEKNKKYRKEVLIKKERLTREQLDNSYVVKVIKKQFNYKIKTEEIHKDLIEVKRNILKLKRITKTEKL